MRVLPLALRRILGAALFLFSPAFPASPPPARLGILSSMRELGRIAPVHYQEPFRRGFQPGEWEPPAEAFHSDLRGALYGGAAGWCFHNGDSRGGTDGRPRRSFDLRDGPLFGALDGEERRALEGIRLLSKERVPRGEGGGRPGFSPRTRISLEGKRWRLNGELTYPGARAEGLLLNVRMVNAVFEDRKRPDFDPDASTARFIARIPEYVSSGVRAFTVCLQGGMPGYEGALNSAFEPDGSLRPSYLERVRRVIEAADSSGAAIVLGCYYQRQDQVLRDEAAVRSGLLNVVRWIGDRGFRNVVLEIANEFPHSGFDHPVLRSPRGQAELLRLARGAAPGLLVSTSGIGDGELAREVAEASDFLLIHLNGVPVSRIPGCIAALKEFEKAIVCNEDDKLGEEAARAAEVSVREGASWGLMLEKSNQAYPFTFGGPADDQVVYEKLKALSTPGAP